MSIFPTSTNGMFALLLLADTVISTARFYTSTIWKLSRLLYFSLANKIENTPSINA
ncbi:MAG: hypothetical protein AAF349_01870 [Cyanobacteria bacterium P01_A01_bin.68]